MYKLLIALFLINCALTASSQRRTGMLGACNSKAACVAVLGLLCGSCRSLSFRRVAWFAAATGLESSTLQRRQWPRVCTCCFCVLAWCFRACDGSFLDLSLYLPPRGGASQLAVQEPRVGPNCCVVCACAFAAWSVSLYEL